jgi:tetratricopeptide (TPR) repeat protein
MFQARIVDQLVRDMVAGFRITGSLKPWADNRELRMSNIEQLVLQAKTCFQVKDYETCMSLTDEALRVDPSNTEASWLMKEAQRQWEDQRSLEQLEIYVENLKKEAMDLFDKEHYEQCLGMFRFLSELEPENHTLRDYVKLSQQMFMENIGPGGPTANEVSTSSSASDTQESESLDLGSEEPEMDHITSFPAAVLPELGGAESGFDEPTAGPNTGVPKVLEPEAIPDSVRRKIIEEYLASALPIRRGRSRNAWLTTALILVAPLGIACLWLYSSFPASRIAIQSTPEKAVVFIDNKRVGETPFRQGIPAGSYTLRIEKKGYQSYDRNLAVERAQTVILELQLERAKAGTLSSSSVEPTVPPESPTQTLAPSTVSEPVESTIPAVQIAESVIHHHLLGSCTGRLKIDGERISFWSSGNSRDSFTRKIKQINNFSLDDKLLIEFKDKGYRFEALAREARSGRERLAPFYEQIKLQKASQAKTP